MIHQTSRWLAVFAVIVVGLCTAIMNWRFSFALANNSFDAYVWGTFSVAVDACKWLALPAAAMLWQAHKARALAAFSIWIVATCFSFTAALGYAAMNRDASITARRQQQEVRSTLQTMKLSPRWRSSAACADATAKQSKEFCETYRSMERKLTTLSLDDDPQSALIARLTGLSEEQSRFVLALALAVVCETVSALGLFAFSALSTRSPKPLSEPKSSHTSPDLAPPRWRPRQIS